MKVEGGLEVEGKRPNLMLTPPPCRELYALSPLYLLIIKKANQGGNI